MTGDAPTESTWQPGDPVYRPEPELRGHCGPCLVAWTGDVNRCPECGQPSTEALHAQLVDAEAWAAQLTDQRAAVLALADKAEHGATRWADPLPVPEWVHQVRLALDGRPVAAPGADTPPDNWPPTSYGPYVALRAFARSLVALDEPTMADARMVTTLADIIERARHALECGPGGDGLPTETAQCGICRLGRMVHINEACPQHGDTPW